MRRFNKGDFVVYRMSKESNRPGRRARHVEPSSAGETYRYLVDKYWVVDDAPDSGELTLRTRTGKIHQIDSNDRSLRRANFFERLFLRARFPKIDQ